MVKLFHGTTEENYKSIMKNGFNWDFKRLVWNCSDEDATYFYNELKQEMDTEEENINECIYLAFQNAGITAAQNKYMGNKLIVLEFDIKPELIHNDSSCQNMENASFVYDEDLKGLKPINVYSQAYNPFLRLFYLIDNEYLNNDLTEEEEYIFKQIKENGLYIEDLIKYEWDEEIIGGTDRNI